jgi:glycosyltransferase involved in cell wall biosynthesis
MKPVVICSNMYNEISQVEGWYNNMKQIADGGILIVDQYSTDGTFEFFIGKPDVKVIQSNIILDEGYGEARNLLRKKSKECYPDAHWCCFFDADERIDEEEFHKFRWIKDYLIPNYDVIAFPRIDWIDREKGQAAKEYLVYPDWQARMTRLSSPLRYVRKIHEQVVDFKGIYTNLNNPKINHYHRQAGQIKRDVVGKVCSYLHRQDLEFGNSYPKHSKEDMYYQKYLEEGLK